MHPTLMTVLANERSCDLRAEAAAQRRFRVVAQRLRRASARRRVARA